MPAEISENYLSRPFTLGGLGDRELIYDAWGSEDEDEIQALIVATAPATYQGLTQDTIRSEPLGNGVWKIHVRYSGLDADKEFTFDTGGGNTKLTQSIGTVNRYAPGVEVAPDFKGAIGVSGDRVEGVDVVSPAFEFTETHRFLPVNVDLAYRLVLFNLTARFNDAAFRGFAAGEVLFLGASGSKRGDDLWSITYRFAASPNVTGLTIGGDITGLGDPATPVITGIDKLGWDYMWVRYEDVEDDTAFVLVRRPSAAYVERVYYPGDFSLLGIGTDPLDAAP